MARIVVLGGSGEGRSAARPCWLRSRGSTCSCRTGGRSTADAGDNPEEWRVSYEEGRHTEELIFDADEVVKSPGIPESAPIVKALRERGIPVVSEIEFAGRYTDGSRTICITGSNYGQPTTTALGLRNAAAGRPERGPCGQHWAELGAWRWPPSILTGTWLS